MIGVYLFLIDRFEVMFLFLLCEKLINMVGRKEYRWFLLGNNKCGDLIFKYIRDI